MSSMIKSIFGSSAKLTSKEMNSETMDGKLKSGKNVASMAEPKKSNNNKKKLSARITSKLQSFNSNKDPTKKDHPTMNGIKSPTSSQPIARDKENNELFEAKQVCDDSDDDEGDKFQDTSSNFVTNPPNGSQISLASHESATLDRCQSSDDRISNILLPEEQCDIPTFLHTPNCDAKLIEDTRRLLKERFQKNPDHFYETDFKRMLADDWTVSRFLLRRRLDPKRTAKLMEECGSFRRQFKMSEVQLWEFPREFHQAGGLFHYAPDRVGNGTVYMRVKMYRRVPEISDVFKAFILCVLEQADTANGGRGTAVIFDLSGCGYQNVDLGFLSWLLSSFRNYCPKGVSYILVYNLPWILNATCKLAMSWMSASNRRALRFVHGKEIQNFIAPENLPDYCGGSCKLDYRRVPEGSLPAIEVCDRLDMTREQALKIRELFAEYLEDESEDLAGEEHKQDPASR